VYIFYNPKSDFGLAKIFALRVETNIKTKNLMYSLETKSTNFIHWIGVLSRPKTLILRPQDCKQMTKSDQTSRWS